jgi:hypothetical protein
MERATVVIQEPFLLSLEDKVGICRITHEQNSQWEETGERPDCNYHHHLSFKAAIAMVINDEAVLLPGKRAIIVYPCVDSYVLQGRKSGGGATVMQLAPIIPSPIHPSRMEELSLND